MIWAGAKREWSALSAEWIPGSADTELGENKPKAEEVGAVRRSEDDPIGNPYVPGIIVPATTASNAVSPRRRARRISLNPRAIAAIPVPAPLPHVPAHVVQAQAVRHLCLHRMRRVPAIPRHRVNAVATTVLVYHEVLPAAFRRPFPLSLGRQTVSVYLEVARYKVPAPAIHWRQAFLYTPLVAILKRLIPAHSLHRQSSPLK